MAKTGLDGLSINPSILQHFIIKEMLNLSTASEGPTGPVLKVAMAACNAGCVSILPVNIIQMKNFNMLHNIT